MAKQELVSDQSIRDRKEPRYKSSEEGQLRCETTLARSGLRRGTVIDLSSSGVRLLCEGDFEAGQPIFTELTTDRSFGIYRGVIRRVEPWVGGQTVLGCSLDEPIPEEVLQELANEGAINRRADPRVKLSKVAKVSWPLGPQEIDAELKDLSRGGMKIVASEPIPENVRVRFRVECGDVEELVVEAKSVWVQSHEDGCFAGVAFTQSEASGLVARSLGLERDKEADNERPDSSRHLWRSLTLVAGAAIACYVALMWI